MAHSCEICASPEADAAHRAKHRARGRVRLVVIEDRTIALCDEHARALRESGVDRVADAQRLFLESGPGRSLLPRRAPLDRRVFPPRPEGRRRSGGRRATD